MYKYSEIDQQIVDQRVEQFRGQTLRFLSGQLSEDEFRPLRLMNGLYMQIHSPMLRVAIPYGLLSSVQLRALAQIADRYDRGFGHLTTRQNIQFNWPSLADVPDILADLAKVQMHAIQTSGACIRNISSDHLAGIVADEIEDPRPYCETIRQWSTLHPEFSFLPRKFKIAVSGGGTDRVAAQVHDIGLHMVKNEAGEIGFRFLIGGGLGRTPVIGKVLKAFVAKADLLSYLDAVLRIYNLHGRRDNKYKARIKILVKDLGIDSFRAMVEAERQLIADPSLVLTEEKIACFRRFFLPFSYKELESPAALLKQQTKKSSAFARWLRRNTVAHKMSGYRAVHLSVKHPKIAPGDISSEQMAAVAELADQYSFGQIRVSHEQNMSLTDVEESSLHELWLKLVDIDLATPNIGTLTDMICCPGLDYCSLANARTIPISKQINERFDSLDYLYDLGEIKVKISGCVNACGHHHVGHIGIRGVDKRGEECYQITLGGSAEDDATLGKIIGPAISKEDVANTLDKILRRYLQLRHQDESFLDAVRRLGIEPFKEAAYA